MAENKSDEAAIPFLRWSGKSGSGMSAMNHRDPETGVTSPWTGQQLADELSSHAKAGNKVTFGAIHNGQIVGESKPAAKASAKSAAKPAAKSAAKPAAKSAVKPAAKPAAKKDTVIAKKAAEGLSKAKGAVKPSAKKSK